MERHRHPAPRRIGATRSTLILSADPPPVTETVSVLIPLLNDAHRVSRCVRALTRQIRVPKLDIVFLDAGSTDLTRQLLLDAVADDPRMRLLVGSQPPRGWCAYAHACEQLAIAARGKSFVFLDPGLALAPGAVAAAVGALRAGMSGGDGYDLVVAEARRRVRTVSSETRDRLTALAPEGHWGADDAASAGSAPRARLRATGGLWATRDMSGADATASARLLAVDATAYWHVGGHSTAAHDPLGELGLVRALQRSGARVTAADGRHAIEFLDATAWPRHRAGVSQPQTAAARHGLSDTENSILHSFTDTARRLLSALALLPPTPPSHTQRALTPSRPNVSRLNAARPSTARPSGARPSAPDPYATQQHDPFALDPLYVDARL